MSWLVCSVTVNMLAVTGKMAEAAGPRLLKAGSRLVHILYTLRQDVERGPKGLALIAEAEETIYPANGVAALAIAVGTRAPVPEEHAPVPAPLQPLLHPRSRSRQRQPSLPTCYPCCPTPGPGSSVSRASRSWLSSSIPYGLRRARPATTSSFSPCCLGACLQADGIKGCWGGCSQMGVRRWGRASPAGVCDADGGSLAVRASNVKRGGITVSFNFCLQASLHC